MQGRLQIRWCPRITYGLGKTPKELGDSRIEEPEPRSDLEGGMHHTSQIHVDMVVENQIQAPSEDLTTL